MIRQFSLLDIQNIVPLMEQLGYPANKSQLEKRLSAIGELSNAYMLVAEMDGEVFGFLGMFLQHYFEYDGQYAQIGIFIVDKDHRRQGIGKQMLERAEKWAKANGARAVMINSGNRNERLAAHQMYENLGYEAKSIGFIKNIIINDSDDGET
ncbi:GNAT family N-acetyltransferase [Gracilibacillus caseinilyticus]|uniref:GNAT family N-acetyltransferase n=1 Tax=Gracilibacillus caseinilyticus TaxID=2932256 RepID=A0ABY4EQY4_9BACI|nr:GNAT family N-acetyltransferase [Gracilibacillus caseinilyticus]UOQ46838.1 GNAT family N-acetyltransferase [Gracilibacillus caseinilyticus]